MAKGDVYRLTIAGEDVARDATWVPGALASEFPVDVVSVTKPAGKQMLATVRLRTSQAVPLAGKTVKSVAAFSAPGMGAPFATIVNAEPVRLVTPETYVSTGTEWPTNEMKWLGAVALIGVTALFASRIKGR